jgi:oxepin-CoA hydrolase/3-oxo-5,6-dehydrosuberyl-CoA semialdehyde dehydrogenase
VNEAIRFDVNDAALRDAFLRHAAPSALARLAEDTRPGWGRMTAQQMVEHLLWAFELSNGKAETACPTPQDQLPRLRAFLYDNRPTPREYMNPVLTGGLPALRYGSLPQAAAALDDALKCFLGGAPREGMLHTHPVFGPIRHEDWHRAHYKHAYHHLLQFGLIESA